MKNSTGFRTAPSDTGQGRHRCFYAVKFGEESTNYLATIIDALKRHGADIAWTATRNIHLTLRFLGDLNDHQVEQAIAAPSTTPIGPGFSVAARGLGAFPMMRAPRVLWAGVMGETQADTDHLLRLHHHTERWARHIGLEPENRRYSPHITLGRVRRPSNGLRELIDDMTTRTCEAPFHRVGELLLMRSVLEPTGPKYGVIGRWEL